MGEFKTRQIPLAQIISLKTKNLNQFACGEMRKQHGAKITLYTVGWWYVKKWYCMLSKVSTRKTYCVPLINQKHVHVLIYWVWLIYKEHGRTKKWNVCLYNLIGNKDTLDTIPKSKGINTRDELLKFHSKYYSSNIMSLAVLGKGELRHPTSVSTLPRKKKLINICIGI